MTSEQRTTSRPEQEGNRNKIDRLCGVFRARSGYVFLGWTRDGRPTQQADQSMLNERAQTSFESYQLSGARLREISYYSLRPTQFKLVGEAQDYDEAHDPDAEDLVTYGLVDEQSKSLSIAITEREILKAILRCRTPWQDVGSSRFSEVAVGAKPMYTLFVEPQNGGGREAVAVLFEPLIAGESNEVVFKAFIKQTISRLLVLDESQPNRSNQKGYLDAIARLDSVSQKQTLGDDLMLVLRSMGLVNFDDDWFENKRRASKGLLAKTLRIARAVGLYDISDEKLDELQYPPPDYDLDTLDLNQFFALTEAMLSAANSYYRQHRR